MEYTYKIISIDYFNKKIVVEYSKDNVIGEVTIPLPNIAVSLETVEDLIDTYAPKHMWVASVVPVTQLLNVEVTTTINTLKPTVVSAPPALAYDEKAVASSVINSQGIVETIYTIEKLTEEELAQKAAADKQFMIRSIKTKRDTLKQGGVKVGDSWFHTDTESRIQYLGIQALNVPLPENTLWKTLGGTFVPMNVALQTSIIQAIAALDTALFTRAEQLIYMVNAAPAISVLDIDINSGWHAVYTA